MYNTYTGTSFKCTVDDFGFERIHRYEGSSYFSYPQSRLTTSKKVILVDMRPQKLHNGVESDKVNKVVAPGHEQIR